MSGGVDSSAAAMLLQQQGYDVTGATLRMFSNEDLGLEQDSACCSLSDVEDAKLVAHKLGIPHYVFNFSPCFRHCVIDRFISEYEAGRTPNPCVDCNKHIKFGELLDRARLMDCEYLATGHYARIIFDADRNRWLLARGDDHAKDQSYMLFNLTQQQLAHILLPLADITKPEIRRMSENRGLVTLISRTARISALSPTATTPLLSNALPKINRAPVNSSTKTVRCWERTRD